MAAAFGNSVFLNGHSCQMNGVCIFMAANETCDMIWMGNDQKYPRYPLVTHTKQLLNLLCIVYANHNAFNMFKAFEYMCKEKCSLYLYNTYRLTFIVEHST